MKILFLTISRITDVGAGGIYTDLMRELMRRGHRVYIASPTERRFKQPEQVIESCGAQILKVRTLNIQKTNVIEKGIGTLFLERQFLRAIRRHWPGERFDLVLYSTPPITFNRVIEHYRRQGARTYLLLKDIFPQNAVDLGMMRRGGLLWRMFRRKEERLYAISDRIGCMSPANCRFVTEHNPGVDPAKVEVCPNSVELSGARPERRKDAEVLRKYGFSADKPLFIYGGNLGKPQGIDFLVEVLTAVRDSREAQFCVVGSGTEAGKLEAWQNAYRPESVRVLKALPKPEYDALVGSADVGMIFLDRRFTIPNFPSRLLSYQQSGIPVLLATDRATDMSEIAEANGFGLWSESGDLEGILKNIHTLASSAELRAEMGERARRHLEENYRVEHTADILLRP